jgi:hypothetical protein
MQYPGPLSCIVKDRGTHLATSALSSYQFLNKEGISSLLPVPKLMNGRKVDLTEMMNFNLPH